MLIKTQIRYNLFNHTIYDNIDIYIKFNIRGNRFPILFSTSWTSMFDIQRYSVSYTSHTQQETGFTAKIAIYSPVYL